MRYVFLALVMGAIVVGAGWVVLDEPVENDWRTDLLDLTPFSAAQITTDAGDSGNEDAERPGKKRRRKKRSRTASTPRPSASGEPALAPPPPGTPSPAELHYQMGLAYLQQKKIPVAITELKKCIAANPKHAMAYRALGMAHSVMGKQSSAVAAFEKFVKLAPNHRDADKVRAIIEAHRAGK